MEHIDDAVFLWERLFSDIANEHAPLRIKRVKGSKTPWVTSKLTELKRDKDYHFRKARTTNSNYHWRMYKKLRNYSNHEERNLKSKYFCQMIEDAKGNGSEMWRAIKQVLPDAKKSIVFSIFEKGKWHTENLSVAKIMNQYFVSIGRALAKPFRNIPATPTSNILPFQFHLNDVNVNFVHTALRSLKTNKAIGLDKLSARLLKDAADVIAPVLTALINRSFTDGVFPEVWKSAKVTALFKDGDKSLKDNYRPISILPTISKIIERAAHVQLCSYVEENKLLPQSQFGFRQKRSTSTALIAFTDQILESMDKGSLTGAVFLDLPKAFDTVDHPLLINKLKSLGVTGKSLAWFHSYLSCRIQRTMCNNALSPPAKITTGVPQGSILGPLLFLVYINGIQSVLNHSKMTMFADDMAFYCHDNSSTNIQSKLNADLAAITSWLRDNKLTLNVIKSKFMIIGSRAKLNQFSDIALVANNDRLEKVTKFKYLGVTINQHLSWHDHIEQLQRQVAKRLGVLKRIKHLLPVYARKIYVTTMVIPILEYASIVWGDKNNKVLMDSIQVLQNKAAKLVLDRAPHSSSTEALKDLNWMNLSTRRQMQRCLFMHNLINDNDRNNMIIRGLDYHSHNTRSKDTIRSIKSNSKWGLQRSVNSALSEWNALPIEIKKLKPESFKMSLVHRFKT